MATKLKLRKKRVALLLAVVLVIVLCIVIIKNLSNSPEKAGKLVDGVPKYSDKIVRTSYIQGKAIVEIKSVDKSLNSVIVNSAMIEEMKNNDSKYDRSLKEVMSDASTSAIASYQMKKAIDLKIVKESTSLKEYYAKVTGFKNVKRFIYFCEDAFDLIEEGKN